MKLHIGGETKKEGWKVLNIQPGLFVDYIGDIRDLSQFDENSIEEIYASHVLEHIEQNQTLEALKGIFRVLKKNGKFYVSVPDLDILCRMFIHKEATSKIKFDVMRMIFGGQIDKYDFHYFGWNFEFLNDYLTKTGFSKIEKVETFNLFKDTSELKCYGSYISLNLIAYK